MIVALYKVCALVLMYILVYFIVYVPTLPFCGCCNKWAKQSWFKITELTLSWFWIMGNLSATHLWRKLLIPQKPSPPQTGSPFAGLVKVVVAAVGLGVKQLRPRDSISSNSLPASSSMVFPALSRCVRVIHFPFRAEHTAIMYSQHFNQSWASDLTAQRSKKKFLWPRLGASLIMCTNTNV